jgi:hypothetical protein
MSLQLNNEKITITNAKKMYRLNDEDLANLEFDVKRNPHRKSLSMYLYHKHEVINVFKQKYNLINDFDVECKLKDIEESKKERSNKRLLNAMNAKIKRKKDLEDLMKHYKLTIRNDSKLCKGFIDGSITDYTVEEVVRRMCEMKYLYEYANIKDAFNEARDEQDDEINAGYIPDCSLFDMAEIIALRKCGGYPAVFPWMQ